MEKLPKDVLVMLAIDLDYADILKLCTSSSRINRMVCQNDYFWRSKLYKTYPLAVKRLQQFPVSDLKKFYGKFDREMKRVTTLHPTVDYTITSFDLPRFISPELINFYLFADFGKIPGTELPINYLLLPLLERGVMSRSLATPLMTMHIMKNSFTENGKKFFKATPDMELYLGTYMDELEQKEQGRPDKFDAIGRLLLPFSRNKFVFNRLHSIMSPGFSSQPLTQVQIDELNIVLINISNEISAIRNM